METGETSKETKTLGETCGNTKSNGRKQSGNQGKHSIVGITMIITGI